MRRHQTDFIDDTRHEIEEANARADAAVLAWWQVRNDAIETAAVLIEAMVMDGVTKPTDYANNVRGLKSNPPALETKQ